MRAASWTLKVGLTAIALIGIASSLFEVWPKPHSDDIVDVANYVGKNPIVLATIPLPVSPPLSEEQLVEVAKKIAAAASVSRSPSACLHATRLAGLVGPDVTAWMERNDLRRVVRLNLNSDIYQNSWRGIEARRTALGERTEHRDQLLAALAQLGVDLACAVGRRTEDQEPFRVRDLLRTSLAEFHLNQQEMSWTATAYALYLPPQSHWFNRYGERFNFDDLTRALISKRLYSEACGGIHLMHALTTILRVDREMHVLNEDTRTRLETYLSMRVQEAVDSQLADGSWPIFWSKSGFVGDVDDGAPLESPAATFSSRMTVGGHLLEWFELLPSDRRPPESTIKHGLLWVASQFDSLADVRDEALICPLTHAVLAVQGSPRHNSNREAVASW